MRAVVIGGVVGYVVATVLFYTVGKEAGCIILGLTFGAAWAGHTERSRHLVGLLFAAIDRHMSQKAAALTMGVTESRLSEWRSGERPASLAHAAELPDEVLDDFARTYLEYRGSNPVAELTGEVRALVAVVRALGTFTTPRQGAA